MADEEPPPLSFVWPSRDGYLSLSEAHDLNLLLWLTSHSIMTPERHLERFTQVMLRIPLNEDLHLPSMHEMRGKACLAQALCSAQFWELANLRSQ